MKLIFTKVPLVIAMCPRTSVTRLDIYLMQTCICLMYGRFAANFPSACVCSVGLVDKDNQ